MRPSARLAHASSPAPTFGPGTFHRLAAAVATVAAASFAIRRKPMT
jgi:hypothetical protein